MRQGDDSNFQAFIKTESTLGFYVVDNGEFTVWNLIEFAEELEMLCGVLRNFGPLAIFISAFSGKSLKTNIQNCEAIFIINLREHER